MPIKAKVEGSSKERACHRVKFESWINELKFTEMKIEGGDFIGKDGKDAEVQKSILSQ